MQLPLDRSARRQGAAVRRGRRAAGLHPEPLGARIAGACGRLARSQVLRLGLLWSAALTIGVAGGLWLGQEGLPGRATEIARTLEPGTAQQLAETDLSRSGPLQSEFPPGELPSPAPEVTAIQPHGEDATAAPEVALAAPAPAEMAVAPEAGEPAAVPLAAPVQSALIVPPGRPAWLANAVSQATLPDRPMIAVVIDDLGLKRSATRDTVALPGPLSLAFLAYAEDLDDQARLARAAGHELLLHQPMEPQGAQDPGPGALLTSLSAEENVARLTVALDRLPQIVGINNHMGSRFTASPAALEPVLETLRQRGLLFLDSRTTAESVGASLARQMGVPSIGRDVFLDHKVGAGRPYVEQQLAEVEAIASETGAAVAIGHPHSGTLEALRAWLPELEARGFQLVSVSAVVRARQSQQLAESRQRD
ncbi:divergent polysaccharide deacetylase family protein [Algihabitans albus]|uniref:divergent polysaccharide deacetylase family protein n=1 Tax=Algihabitans albus TaxID=2164067 RepID=UPI0013C2B071|nr:divergent polysaccharide deacetylase family protein [Algihabitans albus]